MLQGYVYIIGNDNKLYISDLSCTNLELLCENFSYADSMYSFYGKTVFYIPYNAADTIYKYGTSAPFYTCDSGISFRHITPEYLIIYNESDDSIYYTRHDKADFKLISKNPQAEIKYADSEYIYFSDSEKVFVMDYTGKIVKEVTIK